LNIQNSYFINQDKLIETSVTAQIICAKPFFILWVRYYFHYTPAFAWQVNQKKRRLGFFWNQASPRKRDAESGARIYSSKSGTTS
jgi:hypothetical protein